MSATRTGSTKAEKITQTTALIGADTWPKNPCGCVVLACPGLATHLVNYMRRLVVAECSKCGATWEDV